MAGNRLILASKKVLPLQPVRMCHHATAEKFDFGENTPKHIKEKFYPKIGNRDIVGPGFNNMANYIDHPLNPCPSIRFKENTPELLALKEKEKGDWKKLTVDEKKQLYRASFCQTYAEMDAPSGEWKSIVAMVLAAFGITGWFLMFCRKYVLPPLPSTITKEWQEKQLQQMIIQRQGRVEGLASKFDYEKNQWK